MRPELWLPNWVMNLTDNIFSKLLWIICIFAALLGIVKTIKFFWYF